MFSHVVVAATLFLTVGMAAAPSATRAQDASSTPAMQMSGEGHPAHIHAGTCATLGGIDYSLNNLVPPGMMGTPEAGSAMDDMDSTPMSDQEFEALRRAKSRSINPAMDDLLSEVAAGRAMCVPLEGGRALGVYVGPSVVPPTHAG